MVYCWFAASFAYYGLSLNSGKWVPPPTHNKGSLAMPIHMHIYMPIHMHIHIRLSGHASLCPSSLPLKVPLTLTLTLPPLVASLGGSLVVSFSLGVMIEMPAYILAVFSLSRLGRRPTLALAFGGGWLGCTACLVLPAASPAATGAALVGKGFVTCAFGSIFVYASELFPTALRSAALGLCSASARVGGAVAPPVVFLSSIAGWLPMAIFSAASMLAALLVVTTIPETLGQPSNETIEVR